MFYEKDQKKIKQLHIIKANKGVASILLLPMKKSQLKL